MTQIPVTVHEQALGELLPVKREIEQSFCALLPEPGDFGLLELNVFLSRIGSETEAMIVAVDAFGEKAADWRRHSDTDKLVNSAWECTWTFQSLMELRHDPLLMNAEYDIRQVVLALIDRVLWDILGWIERYENIVRHPEEWQGKDAHLMLVIEAKEELNALHRLVAEKGYALNSGVLLPEVSQSQKGFGLMGLLAAFGLGIWLGDDD